MLGGSSQGNGAFSALPQARRHQATTGWASMAYAAGSVAVPCAASEEAGAPPAQRKRAGCLCDDSGPAVDLAGTQPLDLSLPKIKVRQHWSGGSIVQVNEATIISIGADCCDSAGRLNVSFVTARQPFRLQIDIPLPDNSNHNKSTRRHQRRKCGLARPPGDAMTAEEDDDLKRLADCAHQLVLSGYYYPNLSWKESIQLLQNTRVGTFLVRDSSAADYLYALSIQTDKGPTSVRVHYSSRGFRLDASTGRMADHLPRFRTVLDLVDHYVAKGAQCRDKGHFWLDNSGQVHSEVLLIRPLMRDCPSLKHLCRLAWNRQRGRSQAAPGDDIPHSIHSYLDEYPFQQ